jgi:hypothetical protein
MARVPDDADAAAMTSVSDRALQRLNELGAGAFPHVHGSLALHLRGTEMLLRQWGNREALALAGLYHAVYGTDAITGRLADPTMRETVAAVIGVEAEGLAYLYGACARDAFHPRIGTATQCLFVDRFTGSEYAIPEAQLRDFCEITLANIVELALGSEKFRTRYGAELVIFCERMHGLVSDAGLEACTTVLVDPSGTSCPPDIAPQ